MEMRNREERLRSFARTILIARNAIDLAVELLCELEGSLKEGVPDERPGA
jgi:hypothetical protein